MKIECVQEKLKESIGYMERIANKHMTLPVLSCLLFDATQKNSLTIKATNIDLGIEITIPVKTTETGVVAVPASTINSFLINAMSDDKGVVLETTQGNLKISTARNSSLIKTQQHEDFPSIPRVTDSNTFSMHSGDFVRGLKSVWYSSSTSSIKPELSSVYIYCDGEFVVFVATDSFRLAEKKVRVKKNKDFGQILLPFKNIPDVIKILEAINDEVEVSLDKNQISFSYKGLYLISRVIDGVFPDYKQIIPKSSSTEIVALKQDLVNSLKLSNIFSDKFNQINIKANTSSKICEIKTKNNDVGENITTLDSTITGEPIDINFNYKYIIDCFQSIDSDSVSLVFNGLNKPMIISPVSDTSFRYIVMPMNR
ncbi:MAG: DNA polymerase III subunit beta [Patescibacteria group bacterium]